MTLSINGKTYEAGELIAYVKKLEKENVDIRDNYDQFRASAIPEIEKLQKENKELNADNDARKFAMAMSEKVEKQLREENGKLKEEWQEQVQKANDEGYARTLQTIQLSKAKEIIRELIHEISVFYIATDRIVISSTVKEAEQFLKDSEVEK